MIRIWFLSISILGMYSAFGQFLQLQSPYSAAALYNDLLRLQSTQRVLYVAAHPDDENTRFIAYMANAKHAKVAYLSLTRGDGGQNLIGTQLRENLGLIRTYELLAARHIDGGKQYFTRANDFGFSKTAEETLEKWDKSLILNDMVTVIREFKPDVIITRFPPAHKKYDTHGHHTASAILAEEAMDLAAQESYTDRNNQVAWKVKRLFWNTSTWYYQGSKEQFNPEGKIKYNVGEYDPITGRSYNEIAAISRSQHQSQGFGAALSKDYADEWLEYVKGEKANSDIFEGIAANWARYPEYVELGKIIDNAIAKFSFINPKQALPALIEAQQMASRILMRRDLNPNKTIIAEKLELLNETIVRLIGLHIEFRSKAEFAAVGTDSIATIIQATLREATPVSIQKINFSNQNVSTSNWTAQNLELGKTHEFPYVLLPNSKVQYTEPQWLSKLSNDDAMYIPNKGFENQAHIEPFGYANIELKIENTTIKISRPLEFVQVDRAKGELHTLFTLCPPLTAAFSDPVVIGSTGKEVQVNCIVKAYKANVNGNIEFEIPKGWELKYQDKPIITIPIQIAKLGEEVNIPITLIASKSAELGELHAQFSIDGQRFKAQSMTSIEYNHIPKLNWFPPSVLKLMPLEAKGTQAKVGYISGAGDEVAEFLKKAGVHVTAITEANFNQLDLSQFNAILTGIRAYNTEKWLVGKSNVIQEYVKNGGNFIVQYNTTWGLLSTEIFPYPLTIGRGRVTKEAAKTEFVLPNHAIFSSPNPINLADFDNWKQERGLYFASKWDESKWKAPIQWADPNEDAQTGALLIGEFGKGNYVYTGISFFRELPEAVPGAYKLLLNLLNL